MVKQDGHFPAKYKNAIFSAQHGSWNAVKPRGERVMVTYLDDKGNAAKSETFAEGWMTPAGYYLDRPATVRSFFHAGREKILRAI